MSRFFLTSLQKSFFLCLSVLWDSILKISVKPSFLWSYCDLKFWIIFGLMLYCELQEEHKRKPRQLKNCRLYEFFPNWIDCGFSYLRQWWLHRWQWPLLHIYAFWTILFIRSEDLDLLFSRWKLDWKYTWCTKVSKALGTYR